MEVKSPGGFVFGIQGYEYGEVKPKSITFFTDGTTRVCDHRGNAIPEYTVLHSEAVKKLRDTGIDWQKLVAAGWPQLSYDELKELNIVPPTPLDELAKISNKSLRQDSMRFRKEYDDAKLEEIEV